jgi:SNF2 family DNA or RNA helicase
MKITIAYDSDEGIAKISCDNPHQSEWVKFKRMICDSVGDSASSGPLLKFPWRLFLMLKSDIGYFIKRHNIQLEVSSSAENQLQLASNTAYSKAISASPMNSDDIEKKLIAVGFDRELTDNQKANVSRLAHLPGGATFSVPGAGKTTEALAYFYLNSEKNDRLLVVAPKNAFCAWDEQLASCVPGEASTFIRLRGGIENIRKLLSYDPKFMLVTYQQFYRIKDIIADHIARKNTFMFLDESHRIKNGRGGITADAILNVSYLPTKKLILSGTPMPQGVPDMIPQFSFLYPSERVKEDNVISMFQPIFVRTTKDQLKIPPVIRTITPLKMGVAQRKIYDSLRSELKRQMINSIGDNSIYSLRKIGKCTIKLLQFTSNPSLLAGDMNYIFDQRMGELISKTNGPKIDYACARARELAADGKKVIIWSTFVENVELLAMRLRDIGADYIHGGIDAGDEDDWDTREGKIKKFHDDPNAMVLVANPAAASEGISLHTVCQHAIYVDRSFNAAQYLQSEDRIHRLGLKEYQTPFVEILECENSIDQVVQTRLAAKVSRMAEALSDPNLSIENIPYDYQYFEDDDVDVDREDVKSILEYFFGGDI